METGRFPTPTANFTPKRIYAVQYDKLWEATLDALDKNNIAVVSTDKADGIIQTDYIAGPGTLIVLIPVGAYAFVPSASLRKTSVFIHVHPWFISREPHGTLRKPPRGYVPLLLYVKSHSKMKKTIPQ